MQTNFGTLTALITAAALFASGAAAQISVLEPNVLPHILDKLHEIDFENLPEVDPGEDPTGDYTVPTPYTVRGVTFHDPAGLDAGFCSSPTCEPDPDNAIEGNIGLFLNWRGSI